MEWGSSPEREERDTEKVTTGFCSLKRMEEKRKVGMKEGKAGERKEGRKTRKKERERKAEKEMLLKRRRAAKDKNGTDVCLVGIDMSIENE